MRLKLELLVFFDIQIRDLNFTSMQDSAKKVPSTCEKCAVKLFIKKSRPQVTH